MSRQKPNNGVNAAGLCCIPTIGFGPQHEIYAHQTDEVVPVDALIKPSLTRRDGVVPSSQPTTFYAAIPQAILDERAKR